MAGTVAETHTSAVRRRPRGGEAVGKGRERASAGHCGTGVPRGSGPPPRAPSLFALLMLQPETVVPPPLWHADVTVPASVRSTSPPDRAEPQVVRRRSTSKGSESGSTCSTASTDGSQTEASPKPKRGPPEIQLQLHCAPDMPVKLSVSDFLSFKTPGSVGILDLVSWTSSDNEASGQGHLETHLQLQASSLEDRSCKAALPPGLEAGMQARRPPPPPTAPPNFAAPVPPPPSAAPRAIGTVKTPPPPAFAARVFGPGPREAQQNQFVTPVLRGPPFSPSGFVAGVSAV